MEFRVEEYKNKMDGPMYSTLVHMYELLKGRIGIKSSFSILCLSTNVQIIRPFSKMIQKENGRMLLLDESKQKLDATHDTIGYLGQTIDPYPNMMRQLNDLGSDVNIQPFDIVYIDVDECGKENDPHEVALDTLHKFQCILPKVDEYTVIVINTLFEKKLYLEYVDDLWRKLDYKKTKWEGSFNFYEKK